MVKIAIHGAGSIGCFVGGVWASSGLDVTLVGRDHIGDTVNRHGLILTDYDGFSAVVAPADIAFSNSPDVLSHADIIGLAVKSVGTEAAATEIKAHAKKGAVVVSLQNGISNVETLRRLLPGQTVLAGMVPFNVVAMENGRWHKGTRGDLMADKNPALDPIVAAAKGSPAELQLRDDMVSVAWGKLMLNLNNAVNALSGATLLEELSDRDFRRVLAASIREGLTILAAAGIEPAKVSAFPPKWLPVFVGSPNFLFNSLGLKLQKIDAHARSSMSDDFRTGRRTEIDYLNGEVVRLAEKMGLAAPVNSAIVALVKKAEAGERRAWSGSELKKALLG